MMIYLTKAYPGIALIIVYTHSPISFWYGTTILNVIGYILRIDILFSHHGLWIADIEVLVGLPRFLGKDNQN